ncbi:hypothetical protein L2E82_08335 [Cichorium intybus]|uniref:Uncharacterized protein n=1 Tax=Cichorium intybus TaxID=13427 RepID=A0ACB9G7A2_CICIN|nr:hypothetical protein L2E82_08335 [Cichorium intybus]
MLPPSTLIYAFAVELELISDECKGSSNQNQKVDGILTPPTGPDCWPKKDSKRQWLVFYELDNMTLTATGTIEGNGQQLWDLPCNPHRGPGIENTKSVGIYNSTIGNGDDCISIGPGCLNVDIEGVTCGPSHGIRYEFAMFTFGSHSASLSLSSLESLSLLYFQRYNANLIHNQIAERCGIRRILLLLWRTDWC